MEPLFLNFFGSRCFWIGRGLFQMQCQVLEKVCVIRLLSNSLQSLGRQVGLSGEEGKLRGRGFRGIEEETRGKVMGWLETV